MTSPTSGVDDNQPQMSDHQLPEKCGDGGSMVKTTSEKVGRIQKMDEKPFTLLSALAIAHGTTNTAVGLLLVVASTVPFGGSTLAFWGYIAMAAVGLCVASSLAELVSAMPHAGGQYVWVANLSPPGSRRLLSFVIAILSWLGAVLTNASACLGTAEAIFAIVALLKPDFKEERWMIFVLYEFLNMSTLVAASFEHALPKIANTLLAFTVFGIFSIFVTLFAFSNEHATAAGYFTHNYNISGWNSGMAFMIGLNGTNWCFSCLDAVVHISEEIPRPQTNVPKSLMYTILVSFLSGMLIITSVYINIPDLSVLEGGGALAAFYYITRGNVAAAVALWTIPITSSVAAVWAIHTWQSRLAWSLARQGGLPFSGHLRRIAPAPFHTPIWALIFSAFWTTVLGTLYLASSTAFNSLISAGIIFQYISYSVPIALLLRSGRSKFNHGPFWNPRIGKVANYVVLMWTLVALVMYCFPYYLPVEIDEMNYCSVVIVGFLVLIGIMWVAHARKHYDPLEHGEFGQ